MQLIWFGNPAEELPDADTWREGDFCPAGGSPVRYRVSTQFEVVDGRRMPAWLEIESWGGMEVWARPVRGSRVAELPTWGARVEMRDGAPQVVNIGFSSSFGSAREVKPSDFQRIRSVIYVFYAAFCADIGPDGKPIHRTDSEADKRIAEFLERRRTGRQRLKTDDYKRAAQVYRSNFDGTPTQAVADAFGVGIRQGGNIVSECRRRGFLPPTKQGKKQA
jgi:hypothetical protein